jgi:putative nucleotidyltransferase with HDIG domain
MNLVTLFSNSNSIADRVRSELAGVFDLHVVPLACMAELDPLSHSVVDVDLKDTSRLPVLKSWLQRKPKNAKVIFVTDKAHRIEEARANALGATDVLYRPIDGKKLLAILSREVAGLGGSSSDFAQQGAYGVAAAHDSLKDIFSTACLGTSLNAAAINSAGEAVVGQIESQGLAAWIEAVRKHHSQTYQHCLLVTGLAVAFGQHLGVSHADRQRLSFAGMLHDIGKARVPVALLEKPGPLDQDEQAIMREHPLLGLHALENATDLQKEMINAVAQHHEYLDGSGYPYGLQGNDISDLVRMLTICDVFGALIERRSYKPPLSGETAYQILLDMGPRLDKVLCREFRFAQKLDQAA